MAVNFEYNGVTYKNAIELTRAMPLLTSVMVGYYDGAEVLLANAGALCYDTVQVAHDPETLQPNKIGKRITTHCRDSHHNTVIEHGAATFVKKVPIFVARQDLRARHASFDERSLRYCRATDGSLTYFIPHYYSDRFIQSADEKGLSHYADELRLQRDEWIEDHERAIQRYSRYTDDELNGMWDALGLNPERVRETQRSRLPVGINTVYMDTRNLWSWIHHSEKRLCLRAQDEIRRLRRQEVNQLAKVFPTVFGDVNMPCYMAGGCPEAKKCGLIQLDETGKWALPYLKRKNSTK
ncbi:FAD-dependent thymidylate synthase (plasmid) [Paenibacillus sp. S-38]|uniref:FAD-dependent thymidylate synthase n=1 Tax=Paenibacillus sp. S-38 TaxID=3416710 RepID=UPI003CF69B16